MATLARRTYEASCGEDGPWEETLAITQLPQEAISGNRGDVSEPPDEAHLRAWCLYYGIAYAVARLEDPLGSEEKWRAAARDAANKTSRWHMSVGGRPEGEE